MVDKAVDRDDNSKVAIIREVYDSENAHETFEYELERALESECTLIIIEPSKLGDETSRWITVGNCLHKTATLSGLAAIATGLIWDDRPYICGTLGFVSLITCGLYTLSWQFDPCCQYQVETDTSKLPHPEVLTMLAPSFPTFLVRKDDTRRRILHTTVTLAAISIKARKGPCDISSTIEARPSIGFFILGETQYHICLYSGDFVIHKMCILT
ncbi:hypothetical protein KPH14_011511 [Odynerus spinipes]|uniref:Transmembrane protein 11 n=1 Tax=Odynerus spinipes TaxID=1348599 RepID=A0AAD9RKE1_9HYME|nr:hypothetical protein KPH14_011511 [Odynerus spinipes]